MGDAAHEWYGNTACGTFAALNGSLFTPGYVPAGNGATSFGSPWIPVSQTAVSGAGVAGDPYTMTTVVRSSTGVLFTQTDTYVVGNEFYETSLVILNSTAVQQLGTLYTAGDCYLGSNDAGYGKVFGTSPACSTSTAPGARVEQLIPRTSGNNYQQAGYSTIWATIGSKQPFPNTCACNNYIDNGIGISWPLNIAPGNSAAYAWTTAFSPTGQVPLVISATPDIPVVLPAAADGYTIQVSNPNSTASTVTEVTVTLPPGTTYTPGTTTGVTTADPSISGNTLTFSGSFPVVAGGVISLHFGVTVPTVPGTYTISAGATAPGADVTPITGAAPIRVLSVADIAITKVVSGSSVALAGGPPIVFTLTARNNGPGTAQNVRVADIVPAGMTFNAPASSPQCFFRNPDVLCASPSDLAPGGTAVFTIAMNAGPTASGSRSNTGAVDADVNDTDLTNNQATTPFTIQRNVDVSVTKSASPTSVAAGQSATFTLRVANAGPASADYTLVDVLPVGMTATSIAGAGCSIASGATCTSSLPPGGSATITLVATVGAGAAAGTVQNSVAVTTPQTDTNPANNSAAAAVTVSRSADLGVSKSPVLAPVAGLPVIYDVVVNNLGPSVAHDVVMTDVVPAGAEFDAPLSSDVCGVAGANVVCTIPALGPAAQVRYQVAFRLPASLADGAIVTNTASVASSDPDPVATNNSVTRNDPVGRSVDLRIRKSIDVDPAVAGAPIGYQLTITNAGPSDASNVVVSDPAIPNVTASSAAVSMGTGTCALPDGSVSCTLPTLAAGATAVVDVDGTLDASTPEGTPIVNTATVSSTEPELVPADNSATASVNTERVTGLDLNKSDGSAEQIAGTAVTYTFTAINRGASDATGVTLNDPGLGRIGNPVVSAPVGTTCTMTAGVLDCDLGPLPADPTGASPVVITVTGTLDPSIPNGTVISNTATLADDEGGNATAVENSTVRRQSTLQIEKTPAAATVAAGGDMTWTVTVTNSGPSTVDAPVVIETPPANFTLTSITGAGATCDLPTRYCTLASLLPGATSTLTVTGTFSPSYQGGPAINKATVLNPQGPVAVDTAQVTVERVSDLTVAKTSPLSTVVAGGAISYVLTVTNSGPSLAEAATATDTLPAGFSFSPVGSSAGCAAVGQVVTCPVGAIQPGAPPLSVVVRALVASDVESGTYTDLATAQSLSTDPTPASDELDTEVVDEADLSLTKSVPGGTAGAVITWTITVSNAGPSDGTAPVVTDTLDPRLTFVSGTADDGTTCTNAGQVVTCALADIPGPGSTVISLNVSSPPDLVPPAAPFVTVPNTATVTATSSDPNLQDNTGSASVGLVAAASLTTSKTGPAEALAGAEISYQLGVSNAGPSTATTVQVRDVLGPRLSFDPAASDPRCVLEDAGINAVVCTVDRLDPGAPTASFTLVARIDPTVSAGSTVVNVASASAPQRETDPKPPVAWTTDVDTRADLAVTKSVPADVVAGSATEYTIVVTNNGPSTAYGVDVVDTPLADAPAGQWVTGGLTKGLKGLPDCPIDGVAFQCSIASLNPGDSLTLTVPITTDPAAPEGTIVRNTVTVASEVQDDGPAPNAATAAMTLHRQGGLRLAKTASAASVVPGSAVDWTLAVANDGPSLLTDVTVRDALPPTVTAATLPPGCTIDASSVVTCVVPSVPPAGSASVVIPTVTNGIVGDSIENTATASAVGASLVSATASVALVESTSGSGSGSGSGSDTSAGLSSTGWDALAWFVPAALLVAVGGVLMPVSRKRPRRHRATP
ncbi:hypothetical protein WDJ51_02370 [Rathayibacter sp. YIM 133350]